MRIMNDDDEGHCMIDMNDVVHLNGSYGDVRATWCERMSDETFFTAASLRWTTKIPTCLLCLGWR